MNLNTKDIDEYIEGLYEIGYLDKSNPFAVIKANYIKRFYSEGKFELADYDDSVGVSAL